jgi:hypothetical protein
MRLGEKLALKEKIDSVLHTRELIEALTSQKQSRVLLHTNLSEGDILSEEEGVGAPSHKNSKRSNRTPKQLTFSASKSSSHHVQNFRSNKYRDRFERR